MEFLAREMASLRMALGEVATRDYVRSELRSLLAGARGAGPSDRATEGERGDPDRDWDGPEPDRPLART